MIKTQPKSETAEHDRSMMVITLSCQSVSGLMIAALAPGAASNFGYKCLQRCGNYHGTLGIH